ncbi:hypothetical protein [Nonomuraea sp. LPB2021202275-12-8]|uniref:hypothetical protein n=1 Tax=Nonomuraea sp. LPB2021202275-12-8 TaxID=3120159 RepID=UPI00300D4A93
MDLSAPNLGRLPDSLGNLTDLDYLGVGPNPLVSPPPENRLMLPRIALLGVITASVSTYFVERFHQQYLHRSINGYCGIGVACPVGLTSGEA